MSKSLKDKTQKSLIWSMTDKFGFQFVALLTGMVTMRLIHPEAFGLIGALAIITMLSNIFVDSGFSVALIRRQNTNNQEYTAVFYFNVLISIVLYAALVLLLPLISRYYNHTELVNLGYFLFLCVIINALGIIPNILLVKALNFKHISLANLLSAAIAGITAVCLALAGFGYWALAWQIILQNAVRVMFIWYISKWKPVQKPIFKVIKELFAFSSILIVTSCISAGIKYFYTMIIGKQYSMGDLGQYRQADKFQQIPPNVVSGALSSVAYPVLSQLNSEKERQLLYFRKLMRITAFLIFPLMLGLIGVAKNFILIFTKSVWLPSVLYLQILSISAIFVPFQMLCLQILNATGLPKWNFRLELTRNMLVLFSLLVCIFSFRISLYPFEFEFLMFSNQISISSILIGFSAATFLGYAITIKKTGKFINYKMSAHIKDVSPYAVTAFAMLVLIYLITFLKLNIYVEFALQVLSGGAFYLLAVWLMGSQVIRDALEMVRGGSD